MYRLFLDFDEGINWYWYRRRKVNSRNCLDLVRLEARRLQNLLPKLGKALILRSSESGWHLRFPDSRLSWQEIENLLVASKAHRGYIYFSLVVSDATLRVSKKSKGKTYPPYLVEVVPVEQ